MTKSTVVSEYQPKTNGTYYVIASPPEADVAIPYLSTGLLRHYAPRNDGRNKAHI